MTLREAPVDLPGMQPSPGAPFGIYVHVPAPARYAVHKLIISRRRPEGFAKRGKDLQQSEALLSALAEKRPMS